MPETDEFTPEVLERIIRAALDKGDIEGVGHAMRLLAVRDPIRCERLRCWMLTGIDLARDSRADA